MEKVEDYRDPEVLRRMYWDERLTLEEMADRLYVSPATVRDHMKKHDIPTRPAYAYFRGKIDYWDKAVLEECIRQGSISFLIAQHAFMQGYACIDTLFNAIILKKEVDPVNYMPIELLTKENIDFYRRKNIG